ncbi:MAG: acyl carrier protein [Synergistaceae bacterium]|nr:acyl carrier protein [Synergistaceae bacterium]
MDIKDFTAKFAAQFFETDPSEFKPETVFKELDEWSSLSLIQMIAMIDAEYRVTVDGQIINQAETIQDLFNAVCELKK